jgi:hypothetical protein
VGEGYRQAWYFFLELSPTSLPTKLLELARAYAHGVEMLLLLLCDAIVLLCVVGTRGREPPFIGGEEGALWKMLPPHIEGTKPTSTCIEPRQHLSTNARHGDKLQPTKVGAEQGQCGCTLAGPPRHRLHLVFYWMGVEHSYIGVWPSFFG